jgi:hypothetical protein
MGNGHTVEKYVLEMTEHLKTYPSKIGKINFFLVNINQNSRSQEKGPLGYVKDKKISFLIFRLIAKF